MKLPTLCSGLFLTLQPVMIMKIKIFLEELHTVLIPPRILVAAFTNSWKLIRYVQNLQEKKTKYMS